MGVSFSQDTTGTTINKKSSPIQILMSIYAVWLKKQENGYINFVS